MAKTLKVSPLKIDGEEFKIKNINLDTKTKIMNELIKIKGDPDFTLFVNVLRLAGFSDDDIIEMDIETTTKIGNHVITAVSTKKKKKSN